VLRERLKAEGIDFGRFRANLRDQMMVERIREREVYQRIRITDLEDRPPGRPAARRSPGDDADLNIAQILVTVPEGASTAEREAGAKAEAALARVRKGEDFATVARELSEDGNRAKGGEIGLRPASRLPDLFVDAVRPLASRARSRRPCCAAGPAFTC
jgi:peptidyl-prolyl cis-trans isomerase SurA